jgi:isovaleryl-CoA dehydrogenase
VDHDEALSRVIDEVVGPAAAEVDASGRFPRRQVEALAETGVLGIASATEVGGAGLGMREVTGVVGAPPAAPEAGPAAPRGRCPGLAH